MVVLGAGGDGGQSLFSLLQELFMMTMMIHRLVCAASLGFTVSSAKQQQFLATLAHFRLNVSIH